MKTNNDKEKIRQAVRESYGKVACAGAVTLQPNQPTACCSPADISAETSPAAPCGCVELDLTPEQMSAAMGYTKENLAGVPEGANLGLGCGNPVVLASLKPGETVVDLGSGGGFDCFLASEKVGATGKIIGVDMTAEMITKARNNAEKMGTDTV